MNEKHFKKKLLQKWMLKNQSMLMQNELQQDEIIPLQIKVTRKRHYSNLCNISNDEHPIKKRQIEKSYLIELIKINPQSTEIVQETGFTLGYVRKLQRKFIDLNPSYKIEPKIFHVNDQKFHVIFSDEEEFLIKSELCKFLSMVNTTFSYWIKKSNVKNFKTDSNFKLMEQCRLIFGGRSTYSLLKKKDVPIILKCIRDSRQNDKNKVILINNFLNSLCDLKYYI